jgi:hypothetical protein
VPSRAGQPLPLRFDPVAAAAVALKPARLSTRTRTYRDMPARDILFEVLVSAWFSMPYRIRHRRQPGWLLVCRSSSGGSTGGAPGALPGHKFRKRWHGKKRLACACCGALRFLVTGRRVLLWREAQLGIKVRAGQRRRSPWPGFSAPEWLYQLDIRLCRKQLFSQLNAEPTLFEEVNGKRGTSGSKRARAEVRLTVARILVPPHAVYALVRVLL